ncbi:MAG: hypothetical protein HUU50_12110 [Candidatus Brocadiae bacterium]|nr:hypothetical protein [Candidatus Brocadiia bacterium]
MKNKTICPVFMLCLFFYTIHAQKIERIKITLSNNTTKTLAYFSFAMHNLESQEKIIRLEGYYCILPSQKEDLGFDFFPIQEEKMHYFFAIAIVENGKLTASAIPKRAPIVFLSVPCFHQDKTIQQNGKTLQIRELLHFSIAQSFSWKEQIFRFWLSQNFIPSELPFALLYSQEDDSELRVFEKSPGELFFEIHRDKEK